QKLSPIRLSGVF
ncbi:hypothetical protein E2320_019224, partial [Naja naja]